MGGRRRGSSRDGTTTDLADVAGELHAVPLRDFVRQRDARAKQLRADDPELADAVRRLPKPTAPAWAVDAWARERADEASALLGLGAELRAAQEDLAGDALRALSEQAHDVVRAAVDAVAEVAEEQDVPLSATARRQVESTLRAAMADPGAADAVRRGLLAAPLSPAGFGGVDLSGAVAAGPVDPAPRRRAPGRGGGRLDRARQAAGEALAELRAAQQAAEDAEREADGASSARAGADARVEALRAQLDEAERAARDAATRARESRDAHDAAQRRLGSAERTAERARRRVDELS